jgi:Reverse transcriptase (RNA-dependent DNA polymerase)
MALLPRGGNGLGTGSDSFAAYRAQTRESAKALDWKDVYHWLVEFGYFPESYVLPPCFRVTRRPLRPKCFFPPKTKIGTLVRPSCTLQFPKTDLTDRIFGVIHPEIHNDIAYHIARNWGKIVDRLAPAKSQVTCYSFSIPINAKSDGRIGSLRSGRMIYEFLWMTEEDLASAAYDYRYLVRADIRNFYRSIYTHSIAWAIHGKKYVRSGQRRFDGGLLGNRLDKLFRASNDEKSIGVPIGPAVSDIVAELVAAAVDRVVSDQILSSRVKCEVVRFKDDYRILCRSEEDGRRLIKMIQTALREYDLEIAEDKTAIHLLPEGLFRPWASLYHAAYPVRRRRLRWKEFRELYLSVLRIDSQHPGTGVVDRFLADIASRKAGLRVDVTRRNMRKAVSMLLMLGDRRTKAFPKILAVIEAILRSPTGREHTAEIVGYLDSYLQRLAGDEDRSRYLIAWISYFVVSNGLRKQLRAKLKLSDPITRSVFNNRSSVFNDSKHFTAVGPCSSTWTCSGRQGLDSASVMCRFGGRYLDPSPGPRADTLSEQSGGIYGGTYGNRT